MIFDINPKWKAYAKKGVEELREILKICSGCLDVILSFQYEV